MFVYVVAQFSKYFVDIFRRVRGTYLKYYHVKSITPTSSIVSRAHWTAFSLDFKRIVTQWLGTTNHGTIACLQFSALAMSTFTETPDFTLLVQLPCHWADALWRLFEIKIKENNNNLRVSQICIVFKEYWLSCVSGYAKLSRTDQFKSVVVYLQLVRLKQDFHVIQSCRAFPLGSRNGAVVGVGLGGLCS